MRALNKQVAFLKDNNTQALKQLEDMSVISSAQAQSIRQSLQNLGAKDAYIQTLQQAMAHKDSLNMALVENLKGAIGDLNDKDINIKIDKDVVYIDISDKLLFQYREIQCDAAGTGGFGEGGDCSEGTAEYRVHGGRTYGQRAYRHGDLLDNWDLSVKRATAVIRILQIKYGMEPAKMAAAGRGEYLPVADNSTAEGRQLNRRTRIVILPQLDQFFKLLEHK